MQERLVKPDYNQSKIHPHLLALWVGIMSIVMIFGSMTSAYIVRRAAGNWLEFEMPSAFTTSLIVILLSSITLHGSFLSFKNGKAKLYRILLLCTTLLGLAFVVLQYQGWLQMNEIGATFTANPSSSFIYVISGLHAAHVLGGIAALIVAMIFAYVLPYKKTLRRLNRFKLVVSYWHFVDILWIYLYLFFHYI